MWRFFMMCKPEPVKVCDKRRIKTAILSPFLVAMTIYVKHIAGETLLIL